MAKPWRTVLKTTGFMIAILYQAISNNKNKKCYLENRNVTMISAENADKNENIQQITGACRALAQENYTHLHNQVANIVHQELAIRCQGEYQVRVRELQLETVL
jgi:hypothetical protein